jgi:hypothetical protein
MSHELSVFYFCLFSVLSHLSHDLIAFLVAQPPLSVSFRFFSVLSDETLPFYFILQSSAFPPSTGHFR